MKRGERDVDVCSADLLCLETEATDGEHRQRFLNDEFYVVFFMIFFCSKLAKWNSISFGGRNNIVILISNNLKGKKFCFKYDPGG